MRKIKESVKKILSYSPFGVYEIYRDKKKNEKRFKTQKNVIAEYLKNTEIKKLQIGCGKNILEGWLNTDLNDTDTIVYLDAGKSFPIETGTFDCIYSEHLFEHLKVEQQINMLNEGYRILKKGGIMRIAMPNLEFLYNIYSNPNTPVHEDYVNHYVSSYPCLRSVFELVADKEEHYIYVINNFFKAWGHQMIHDFSSLQKLALQFNYEVVRRCKVGESEVSFLQNIEKHGSAIPERINLLETMVVEIVK
jgi:predicted SAM-dependent methyltransferase